MFCHGSSGTKAVASSPKDPIDCGVTVPTILLFMKLYFNQYNWYSLIDAFIHI